MSGSLRCWPGGGCHSHRLEFAAIALTQAAVFRGGVGILRGMVDLADHNKAIEAGVDQFGGETGDILVRSIRSGRVTEDRVDMSVRRLLREKFLLGLFDNPFVDADRANERVGARAAREEGLADQAAAHTLLVNSSGPGHLPLSSPATVYVEGMNPEALAGRANVAATPEHAELAVLRLAAPFEQRGTPGSLESFFHPGSLDFPAEEITRIRAIAETVPAVVDVYLDRPAILTPLKDLTAVLMVKLRLQR